MAYNNVTFGSDPEMFIKDTNGLISAIGLIPGDKNAPYEFEPGFSLHPDNVLAEGNIPPVNTKEAFILAINKLKIEISKYADIHYSSCELEFPQAYLQNAKAREFGCTPSFDAWNLLTRAPNAFEAGNMRTSSFHVHIGYDDTENNSTQARELIKGMDLFLGLPSLLLDPDRDRRSLYGKSGDYRVNYQSDITIAEYRSLGGYMLIDDNHIGFVYDQMVKCIEYLNQGNLVREEAIAECIDNYDVDTAIQILDAFKINVNVENSSIRELTKG